MATKEKDSKTKQIEIPGTLSLEVKLEHLKQQQCGYEGNESDFCVMLIAEAIATRKKK